MSGFKDRIALVTGAGSGIGEAISLDLAARGAKVVVADLDLPSATSVAAAIGRARGNAVAVLANVSDPASVERMVETAVSTFGALHLAVNNAGIGGPTIEIADNASRNIRVNASAFIDTPLLSKNLDETVLAQLAGMHPANRLGPPGEVSALACFLLSEDASFINGSYHLVDGSYTAR